MSNDSKKETARIIDLAQELETQDAAVLEITNLRGDPTGVTITMASPHSARMQDFQKVIEKRNQRFLRRIGNPRKLSEKQEEEQNELLRDLLRQKLVLATLGWDSPGLQGKVVYQGKELECTPENVGMVYEGLPTLREQVASQLNDEANFLAN